MNLWLQLHLVSRFLNKKLWPKVYSRLFENDLLKLKFGWIQSISTTQNIIIYSQNLKTLVSLKNSK